MCISVSVCVGCACIHSPPASRESSARRTAAVEAAAHTSELYPLSNVVLADACVCLCVFRDALAGRRGRFRKLRIELCKN